MNDLVWPRRRHNAGMLPDLSHRSRIADLGQDLADPIEGLALVGGQFRYMSILHCVLQPIPYVCMVCQAKRSASLPGRVHEAAAHRPTAEQAAHESRLRKELLFP